MFQVTFALPEAPATAASTDQITIFGRLVKEVQVRQGRRTFRVLSPDNARIVAFGIRLEHGQVGGGRVRGHFAGSSFMVAH